MGHLVVGIGGTGFKTLCMLKAALQATNPAGGLPQNVALRAIDTEKPEDQLIRKRNEIEALGGVVLDGNEEYIWLGANDPPIGANLLPVGNALKRGGLPAGVSGQVQRAPVEHFTSWFQTDTMLRLLGARQWSVDVGAGQQRQMARLSLFWNVQNPATSVFHNKISAGITRAVGGGDLHLILIGSTVGGTGAGLFVDVAYLVRQLAPAGTPCTVTAFLLVPEAFKEVPELKGNAFLQAQARSYACLREMEHFSVGLMGHTRGFRIIYNPASPLQAYQGHQGTLQKLLDAVYYIDGANRLNERRPESGTLPLLADIGLALLSDTGVNRQNHMLNVVTIGLGQAPNQAAQELNDRSFSSGCGTFSLILPMAQIVDALSWRSVSDVVEVLAKAGETSRTLSPNRPGGNAGRSELADFCSVGALPGRHWNPGGLRVEDYTAGSTDLLQDIYDQGTVYGAGDNVHQVELAARTFENRSLAVWQQKMILRATDQADPMKLRWDAELGKNFVSDDSSKRVLVPVTLRGEDCRAAWRRVRGKVSDEFTNILGTERSGGFSGGSLQGLLKEVRQEILLVIRERMWLTTLNMLNGETQGGGEDSRILDQRGNGLGYLNDLLLTLQMLLDSYSSAIRAGQSRRNQRGGKAERTKAAYDEICQQGDQNPCPGLLPSQRDALRRSLLDAAQDLLDLRRTEIIEAEVLSITATLVDELKALRGSIVPTTVEDGKAISWAEHLLFSREEQVSLLDSARESQTRAEAGARGANALVREIIWDPAFINTLHTRYSQASKQQVLSALSWWLPRPKQNQGWIDGNEIQLWQRDRRYTNAKDLEEGLLRTARRAFDAAWQEESILKYLKEREGQAQWAPGAVAGRMQTNCSLALAASGKGVPSTYIVVPEATKPLEDSYREALRLAVQGGPDNPLKPILPGKDRFRITFVEWRDLIGITSMQSFADAAEQYRATLSKYEFADPNEPTRFTRETLHSTPGEVQAVGIEARLAKVEVDPPLEYRPLHYEVIQQLEDIQHVEAFLNAWLWRVVTERSRSSGNKTVRVFGFDLPEKLTGGPGPSRKEIEYWLTDPQAGANPSFLAAMWDWNFDWKDLHPKQLDEKGRQRPVVAGLNPGVFDEVAGLVKTNRNLELQRWLKANSTWQQGLEPTTKNLYDGLPKDAKATAASRWAEAQYIYDRLKELREREFKASIEKEKDMIAALMVLLWQWMRDAVDAWWLELQPR